MTLGQFTLLTWQRGLENEHVRWWRYQIVLKAWERWIERK